MRRVCLRGVTAASQFMERSELCGGSAIAHTTAAINVNVHPVSVAWAVTLSQRQIVDNSLQLY